MTQVKNNDQLIEELLQKVEEKKNQIEKIKNPEFKTNLSFSCDVFGISSRINLNAASDEVLFSILGYLERMIDTVNKAVKDHQVSAPSLWYGYPLTHWRDDVILKIRQRQSQIQVRELKVIEDRLVSLMSEDKKKDIELTNLSNLLNG